MAEQEIAIRVDGVSKDFILPHLRKNSVKSIFTSLFKTKENTKNETQHALKDISFEIKKGEFFGIVGRNGSGKSTLLKILAGIYQPTKGSVGVTGKLVPFIELGVGFNPELTGRENVYLNGALLGFDTKHIDDMYDDIVEFAELERFMDQKLKNYSSGMQVRLAFSMAIRADADILLIDEVLAVGDADFQRKCFEYFKSLKKNKKTVVFVSHDMDAIREYCDKAVLIEESSLIDRGEPRKIAGHYTRLFMGAKTEVKGSSKKRWGASAGLIEKPKVRVDDSSLLVEFFLRTKEAQSGLICGFSIKNSEGVSIIGTNSRLNQDGGLNLEAHEVVKVRYGLDNYLNDGKYTVDLAILGEDGVTVKDWWEDACIFIVRKERHLPSLTNPKIIFHTESSK